MNPITDLKNRIAAANKAYREGNPFMSDDAFDKLCEDLQKQVPANDYKSIHTRSSLSSWMLHATISCVKRLLLKNDPFYGIKIISKSFKTSGLSA